MWKKRPKNEQQDETNGPPTETTGSDNGLEAALTFFAWAREQGAVHIKSPGGYEAMWLPPETATAAELTDDPQFEEVTMAQWSKMRPPGLK